MPDRPPTFHEKTFDSLKDAIDGVCSEVPEVEAVGVVVLWRLPDQRSVPSVMIRGADGHIVNPDQFLRLHLAGLRLIQHCVDNEASGVSALRELASNLATRARLDHESRTTAEPEARQAPRQEALDGDGPAL